MKRFLTIDGNGDWVFLLATLGGAGVTPANDVALLAISPDDAAVILAREGDVVDGASIAVLTTLVSVPGTPVEARWRYAGDSIGVKLTLSDGKQALYTIPATATGPADWIGWAKTGDLLPDSMQAGSFGMPGFGPDGCGGCGAA